MCKAIRAINIHNIYSNLQKWDEIWREDVTSRTVNTVKHSRFRKISAGGERCGLKDIREESSLLAKKPSRFIMLGKKKKRSVILRGRQILWGNYLISIPWSLHEVKFSFSAKFCLIYSTQVDKTLCFVNIQPIHLLQLIGFILQLYCVFRFLLGGE